MFAVIQAGGKQFEVKEGQELKIEKVEKEIGENIAFEALLIADEEGTQVKIGTPLVSGAKITAKILEHGRT